MTILFSPQGADPSSTPVQISGLDPAVGNSLGQGLVTAALTPVASGSNTFELNYQATLGDLILPDGSPFSPPGLNTTYQITVVARVKETIDSFVGNQLKFHNAGDPGDLFNVFYYLFQGPNDPNRASSLKGTGFDSGQLILSGKPVTSDESNFNYFNDPTSPADAVKFDQFGNNSYPGITAKPGIGTLVLTVGDFTTLDSNFFRNTSETVIDSLSFNSSLVSPFNQTYPSKLFQTPVPGGSTIQPALGQVNGLIASGPNAGQDFQFQADSNFSFNTETASLSLVKLTNGVHATDPNGTNLPKVPVGSTVTWIYQVTNPVTNSDGTANTVSFSDSNLIVTDNQPGVTPTAVLAGGYNVGDLNHNHLLDPGETFTYTASAPALDLSAANPGVTIVDGGDPNHTGNTQKVYENTGKVTGIALLPFTTVTRTSTDVSHYSNPTSLPGLTLVKLTDGVHATDPNGVNLPRIAPGATVTWTYQVTNPLAGNVSFAGTNLTLTDNQPGVSPTPVLGIGGANVGDVNHNGKLDPGETWVYSATAAALNLSNLNPGVVIVPGGGNNQPVYENTGKVTVAGAGLTAADVSHYANTPFPRITLQKLTDGVHATDPNGVNLPKIPVNSAVTWTYLVTNTGNVSFPAANVTVTDNQPGVTPAPVLVAGGYNVGDLNHNALLDPGEVWTYTASAAALNLSVVNPGVHVVDGADPNHTGNTQKVYENTGTATVPGATAGDVSHYANPTQSVVSLVKLTNGVHAPDPSGPNVPVIVVGSAVTWSYQVTDAGNVSYTSSKVVVSDNQPGVVPSAVFVNGFVAGDTNHNGSLDPGETWTYAASASALNLSGNNPGVHIVDGDPNHTGNTQKVYENVGAVTITGTGLSSFDIGTYRNPTGPQAILLQKLTNGVYDPSPNCSTMPLIAPGGTVTWTYVASNPGTNTVAYAGVNLIVFDSQKGVNPQSVLDASGHNVGDVNHNGKLDPAENWIYVASGTAVDLTSPPPGVTPVLGTDPNNPDGQRLVYQNVGAVVVAGVSTPVLSTSLSHYSNPSPQVVSFYRLGIHHQPTQLILTLNMGVNPSQAVDLSRYRLVGPGPDGQFNTADDQVIPFASAVYNPIRHTITLTTVNPVNFHYTYQLTAILPSVAPDVFVGILSGKTSFPPGYTIDGRKLPSR